MSYPPLSDPAWIGVIITDEIRKKILDDQIKEQEDNAASQESPKE